MGAGRVAMPMVALTLLACGDAPRLADGSTDGGDGSVSVIAAPPEIPWLDTETPVTLTPCPEGWREVADRVPSECDPYPASGMESCGAAQAHFPGEPGCRDIGSACPVGAFSDGLPSVGTIVFVDASAGPGGDGSRSAPFAALADVPWASIASGTVVALAKGRYEGALPLAAGVVVMGACAGETILIGASAPVRSVVSVTTSGEPAVLRDLTITGGRQTGAWIEAGRSLRAEGVVVDGMDGFGLAVVGAEAVLSLEDVAVIGTRSQSTGILGVGVLADLGGRVEGSHVWVSESAEAGVVVVNAGSSGTLSDIVVTSGRGRPDGTFGRGIGVQAGAHLELSRAVLENNRSIGLFAALEGAEAVLTDVVIREMRPELAGGDGRGISVQDGGSLVANRLVIAGFVDLGFFVADPTTDVSVEHVVIRDGRGREDGEFGRGMSILGGAHVNVSNAWIARVRDVAVVAIDASTTGTLTDVLIEDTDARSGTNDFGRGIAASAGAHLDLARVVLRRNHELGIFINEGASASLEDVVVRDTLPLPVSRVEGLAIGAQNGGVIDGRRIAIEGAYAHGVLALGASVTLQDLVVQHVQLSACADTGCPRMASFGHGLSVIDSDVTVTRFEIDDVALCGFILARAGFRTAPPTISLSHGVVSNAEIGACLQVADYDLNEIAEDVAFRDNATNLDATTLPVPELFAGAEP